VTLLSALACMLRADKVTSGRLAIEQPSCPCQRYRKFLYAEGLLPPKQHFWNLVLSTYTSVQPLDLYSGLCQLCLHARCCYFFTSSQAMCDSVTAVLSGLRVPQS
jgi:hypothetical protein